MTGKRSYADGCAGAHALDLVGERWALLIVREMLLGPKRFTDLRSGMPGISPNVLTQRLAELEQIAVLRRRKLAPPASAWVYELTEWGKELEVVIVELGRWGARSPTLPREAEMSVNSMILSFRTMFDSQAAGKFKARYELRFGENRFRVEVADGEIDLVQGNADQPDAIIDTDPNTLAALVYDKQSVTAALRSGALRYEGSKSALKRFLTLFTLPEQAPQQQPEN